MKRQEGEQGVLNITRPKPTVKHGTKAIIQIIYKKEISFLPSIRTLQEKSSFEIWIIWINTLTIHLIFPM